MCLSSFENNLFINVNYMLICSYLGYASWRLVSCYLTVASWLVAETSYFDVHKRLFSRCFKPLGLVGITKTG